MLFYCQAELEGHPSQENHLISITSPLKESPCPLLACWRNHRSRLTLQASNCYERTHDVERFTSFEKIRGTASLARVLSVPSAIRLLLVLGSNFVRASAGVIRREIMD
jgi:hypothetical protein